MEQAFVNWLHARTPPHPRLTVGLGDDAAVFTAPLQGNLVATVDSLTDGVDFLLAEIDPLLVGKKAVGVNLSDLAAMAARPLAILVAVVAPRLGVGDWDVERLLRRIYDGVFEMADLFGVALAGGDTNVSDGPLNISVTALGETSLHGPLTRSGGQVGDVLFVTGSLGGSLLGRHLQVAPRVHEALLLHARYAVTAGIDISDGLALDASRMAMASGCGALLDLSSIPLSSAAHELAQKSGRTAIEHALGDGEDFELLFSVAPGDAEKLAGDQPCAVGITRIGQFVSESGLWQTAAQGTKKPLAAAGYQHGAS